MPSVEKNESGHPPRKMIGWLVGGNVAGRFEGEEVGGCSGEGCTDGWRIGDGVGDNVTGDNVTGRFDEGASVDKDGALVGANVTGRFEGSEVGN